MLWKLIRFVLYVEINGNYSSNQTRNYYLKIIGKSKENVMYLNGNNLFELHISDENSDEDDLDEGNYENSDLKLVPNKIIKTKDNNIGSFIIMLYCFLSDYNMIVNSVDRVKEYQLDHLFPIKWWPLWENKIYSRDQVIEYLKSQDESMFNFYSKNSFIIDIENIDLKFELERNKKRDLNRLIEYIGNKWVLNKKLNAATKNKEFSEKKAYYDNDTYAKYPNNSNSVGMDNYNDFTYKDIVLRSLQIVNTINKKWLLELNSLN